MSTAWRFTPTDGEFIWALAPVAAVVVVGIPVLIVVLICDRVTRPGSRWSRRREAKDNEVRSRVRNIVLNGSYQQKLRLIEAWIGLGKSGLEEGIYRWWRPAIDSLADDPDANVVSVLINATRFSDVAYWDSFLAQVVERNPHRVMKEKAAEMLVTRRDRREHEREYLAREAREPRRCLTHNRPGCECDVQPPPGGVF